MTGTTKNCSKCNQVKVLDDFGVEVAGKYGRRSICRACVSSRDKERYATNERRRESMKARRKRRYSENPEVFKEYDRKRREAGYFKEYGQRPEVKEKTRRYQRENYDPDSARLRNERYRQRDPERYLAKLRRSASKRRAIERSAFVEDVCVLVLRKRDTHCYLCKEELGREVHIDHIIPLSRGGLHCYNNVALTHPSCNLRKSAKLVSEIKEGR